VREEVREKMIGLLPEWWSNEKAEQCVPAGRNGRWSSLSKKIAKADVMSHYGDMPMQLRYLGEQILGTGPGGQSGTAMITMKMMMEGCRTGNMAATQLDISQAMG
jgi:splicing suppressor protein 51